MSYHSKIIHQVLEENSGNIAGARNRLMNLAAEDPRFLWGVTKAMLPGILTYALEKASRGEYQISHTPPRKASPKTTGFDRNAAQADPVDLDGLMDALAKTINTEADSKAAKSSSKDEKVSQSHIDAIHKIAKRKYSS